MTTFFGNVCLGERIACRLWRRPFRLQHQTILDDGGDRPAGDGAYPRRLASAEPQARPRRVARYPETIVGDRGAIHDGSR